MSAFFDKIIDELQLFNYISKYLTPILVLNIVNFYQIKKNITLMRINSYL